LRPLLQYEDAASAEVKRGLASVVFIGQAVAGGSFEFQVGGFSSVAWPEKG